MNPSGKPLPGGVDEHLGLEPEPASKF